MTFRLIAIDDALRTEHFYLEPGDECYCLGEYIPRQGYTAGPINDMISNFKKPVTRRGLQEYRYKEGAIVRAGQLVRQVLSADALVASTFIPIPPSKARSDPLYDDRLVRVLRAGTPELDVREALVMRQSVRAHHEYQDGERRPTPDDLYEVLELDAAAVAKPLWATVFLFDDVLTAGTHFKACKRRIFEHAPTSRVIGLFIGRRKLPPQEAADFASVSADLE